MLIFVNNRIFILFYYPSVVFYPRFFAGVHSKNEEKTHHEEHKGL